MNITRANTVLLYNVLLQSGGDGRSPVLVFEWLLS